MKYCKLLVQTWWWTIICSYHVEDNLIWNKLLRRVCISLVPLAYKFKHLWTLLIMRYEFPQIINIPITETEVICTIFSLKNKTSCGYDGLSNKILNLCGRQISKPVTYIYNKSLTCGIWPNCLKYAIIKPCFKVLRKVIYHKYQSIDRPLSLYWLLSPKYLSCSFSIG